MSKLWKKPSVLKRGHPTLQNMNFYKLLSTFVGHFCPPGSGSGFRIRIHRPDWIRIQSGSGYGSGSTTLLFWLYRPFLDHWEMSAIKFSGSGPNESVIQWPPGIRMRNSELRIRGSGSVRKIKIITILTTHKKFRISIFFKHFFLMATKVSRLDQDPGLSFIDLPDSVQ